MEKGPTEKGPMWKKGPVEKIPMEKGPMEKGPIWKKVPYGKRSRG